MSVHLFTVHLAWSGGRNSVGELKAERLSTKISIPLEMAGPGIGTNPDEMLLGAAATCYLITLAALMERSRIPLEELSMKSEGIVDVTNGVYSYEKIIHRPVINLLDTATERDKKLAIRLVMKAEKTCMISKALRGNVEIELEPEFF